MFISISCVCVFVRRRLLRDHAQTAAVWKTVAVIKGHTGQPKHSPSYTYVPFENLAAIANIADLSRIELRSLFIMMYYLNYVVTTHKS